MMKETRTYADSEKDVAPKVGRIYAKRVLRNNISSPRVAREGIQARDHPAAGWSVDDDRAKEASLSLSVK